MSEGIQVGLVSKFGNGQHDYLAQIWQMLISARNGTFPLQVTGGGGGGGTPGLPVWTYAVGGAAPADGTFTADNDAPNSANTLKFSFIPKNGVAGGGWETALEDLPPLVTSIIMTDHTGKALVFQVASVTDSGTFISFNVGHLATDGVSFSGDYQISFMPYNLPTLAQLYALNSPVVTPCPDGTVTPVTSITTVGGIITAIS